MKAALKFRAAFRWEPEIESFIQSRMEGFSLNAPCGESQLGDVRLDANGCGGIRGDLFRLPFPSRTFDTVISDPPWKMTPLERPKHFFELFRVCKIGGRMIFNTQWLPHSKFPVFQEEELRVRQSWPFSNVSVLGVYRKTAEVPNHWS